MHMIKHDIEQLRRAWRRPLARHTLSAGRPAAATAGQLSPRELRDEVLALLG